MFKYILLFLLFSCGVKPQAKKEIFVIGDSISWGYFEFVQEDLKDIANVDHNPDNAKNTEWTLKNVDEWLTKRNRWDVITWNNGVWDCNFGSYGGILFSTPEQYESNLRAIAPKLTAKASHVIFFSTVEIPINEEGRTDECARERNEIAKIVMKDYGIHFYDLHTVSTTIPQLRVNPELQNNVHWTPQGSRVLADFVTESILEVLNK